MSSGGRDEPLFAAECYRCGAEEDLVEDSRLVGLHVCRSCLERVERQNEMIRRGLEEEPGVES